MQGTRDNAEWYVYEEGYEYVHTDTITDPFVIARNGEMRYQFNREDGDTEILRYTEDLIHKGIHDDQDLFAALEDGRLTMIDNPWFEVWDLESDSESDVYDSLDKAEEVALELHRKLILQESE